MEVPNTRRIVLLGKTGVGKSSLANNIFGEAKFKINHMNDLKTRCSPAETKSVNGRSITLIDAPGLFNADRPEEELRQEIARCITECAPGPHAFLIVLKVEKFTAQEKAVITQICEYFPEGALRYAVIVFTHGDQLPEGMKLEEYVGQSEGLRELAKECGGRCHVVDNRYWKNSDEGDYRSNRFQVAELLDTIDKVVKENNGGCYTDGRLQEVERKIQSEEELIRRSSGNMSREEIRKQAKANVFKKQLNDAEPTWIRRLVKLAVIAALLATVSAVLINSKCGKVLKDAPPLHNVLTAPAGVAETQAGVVLDTSPPAGTMGEVVEVLITPVKVIKKTFAVILNQLHDLYERTYNPWNPFE